MTSRYEARTWQNIMPKAYQWAESVTIQTVDAPANKGWNVVAVKKADGGSILDATRLEQGLLTKIKAMQDSLGWKGESGNLKMQVDGLSFLLLPLSSVETTRAQIGRQFGLDIAAAFSGTKCESLTLCASAAVDGLDVVEGTLIGFDQGGGHKSQGPEGDLPSAINLCGEKPSNDSIRSSRLMAQSMIFTRGLQDAPANWLDSEHFARIAADVMKGRGVKVNILNRNDMADLGMGSLLGVAQGASKEPQLVVVEIPGKDTSKTVALVGKGLMFDAGGINIKPSAGMEEMKYDMSGGAAVLGAALFLSQVQPSCNVVCLIGALDNMPSSKALRPGDIVQAMNGKTIEVLNTDAEGRLVLADVMTYACRTFKPQLMIDIATLTGAVGHGLGHAGAAFMTNDLSMVDYVQNLSARRGEPVWQLPLWPELKKDLKGDLADLRNIAKSGVQAGTIMGGLFLQEFVEGPNTKWIHLDIAGTAWSCSATGYRTSGGSGYGLRLMAEACLSWQS